MRKQNNVFGTKFVMCGDLESYKTKSRIIVKTLRKKKTWIVLLQQYKFTKLPTNDKLFKYNVIEKYFRTSLVYPSRSPTKTTTNN